MNISTELSSIDFIVLSDMVISAAQNTDSIMIAQEYARIQDELILIVEQIRKSK